MREKGVVMKRYEKEMQEACENIERAYKEQLQDHIATYIILFGTISLEKLLNKLFKEQHFKPIKIKTNYKMGKSPIKIHIKDVKVKS